MLYKSILTSSKLNFNIIKIVNIKILLLTIVFSIHYNFFILLFISLKICRSNEFFIFTKHLMCALKKSGAHQRFCASERSQSESNLSRSALPLKFAIGGLLREVYTRLTRTSSKSKNGNTRKRCFYC